MAGQEISFIIDWSVWIPISIAVASLVLTVYQMRKKSGRNSMASLEKTIDRAHSALRECQRKLERCGHEKDELRREKLMLLEQVSRLSRDKE